MANYSKSKSTHQVLFATFITSTFFLLLLNKVKSLDNEVSFNFNSKFDPKGKDLLFQRDSSVSATGVLQLTKEVNGQAIVNSTGRALYAAPLQIWDQTSGEVASFFTSFSFLINAIDVKVHADGLAFFLGPPDSQIPTNGDGGYLGLFNSLKYNSSSQIVAVEFDTFTNGEFDPVDGNPHIGIDVNHIASIKTAPWAFRNGEVADVIISYKANTKVLTASLTYPSNQASYIVTANVDLKAILPEWVRVGFSAATHTRIQTHEIRDWYFTSNLKANKNNVNIAR